MLLILLVVRMVLSEGKLVIRLMDQDKLYELVKNPFLLWPLPFTTLVVLRKLLMLL